MAKPRALYSLRLHFNVHLDAGSTTGEHFENVRRAALMAVILRIAFGVCFASKDMAFVVATGSGILSRQVISRLLTAGRQNTRWVYCRLVYAIENNRGVETCTYQINDALSSLDYVLALRETVQTSLLLLLICSKRLYLRKGATVVIMTSRPPRLKIASLFDMCAYVRQPRAGRFKCVHHIVGTRQENCQVVRGCDVWFECMCN
jgi:hypothetical protein